MMANPAELENAPLEKSGRTEATESILQVRRNIGMRKTAGNGGHWVGIFSEFGEWVAESGCPLWSSIELFL